VGPTSRQNIATTTMVLGLGDIEPRIFHPTTQYVVFTPTELETCNIRTEIYQRQNTVTLLEAVVLIILQPLIN
jgi:hypothetical protein